MDFLPPADINNFKSMYRVFREEKGFNKFFGKKLMGKIPRNGDNKSLRTFFDSILNFKMLKRKHPMSFSKHFSKPCLYFKDILKDIDRTFPETEKFQSQSSR